MDYVEPMDCADGEDNQLGDNSCLKYRGLAVIAIFRTFKPKLKLPVIAHADEDRKLLEDAFRALQYGVVVLDDKMEKKVFFDHLEKISQHSVHENCETFALAIVTHGNKGDKLFAYDKEFSRQDVCKVFDSENCSGLKNKPKLFIFHACRGDNLGRGVRASGKIAKEELSTAKLRDHIERNNLILFSTFKENVAFAPVKDKGSVFIRAIKKVMIDEAGKEDSERNHILALLTAVIKITASEDFCKQEEIFKQQPVLMMALHKLYHFRNKEIISEEYLQGLKHRTLLDNY